MSETESQKIMTQAQQEGKVKPPFLKLMLKEDGKAPVSTGQHLVTFLKDKRDVGTDFHTQKEVEEVRYLFEKEGQEYRYYQPVYKKDEKTHEPTDEYNYFVLRMAEFKYGDKLIIEMKKKGIKNYIDVQKVNVPTAEDMPQGEEVAEGTEDIQLED